jgi:UDP-2,3-diacylglucosamine pyrophosphatase LpxH
VEYAAIIPDAHIPYHNVKAMELMLNALRSLGQSLKEIVILGDFADFYAVNSHGKHPSMLQSLREEIEEINSVLDVIDEHFPLTKKIYLEGNHEFRLERFLINQAPALFGVTQWDLLFRLNQRPNWVAIPYGPTQSYKVLGTDLFARHEPYSMSSAKASLSKSNVNLVYGHIHRIEEAVTRRPDGVKIFNFSPGWMGDSRKSHVFSYTKTVPSWETGFAIVEKLDQHFFRHQIIRIHDDITFDFMGQRYGK